jgi:maltose O-acetyltransferase
MNPVSTGRPAWPRRLLAALKGEFAQVRPRQHVLAIASLLLPYRVGNGIRASLLRLRGARVGEGTLIYATPALTGDESRGFPNLSIGSHCLIDIGCAFELGDAVTIGDRVSVGYQVIILTTTHELGPRECRAGSPVRNPVSIGEGALIGARCIILPGVTIGPGAIVDPGSVVTMAVAANTRVRGVPARLVEELAP